MYHPCWPCGAHVPHWLDFSWAIHFVPGGARGVALKSCTPWSCSWADRFGLILDMHKMFKVSSAWFSRRHHRCSGKFLSTEHKPLMKWFLNVCIAHSAALCRWICGGVSRYFVCSTSMKFFSTLEASLSNQCSCGLRPRHVSILYMSSYALMVSLSCLLFSGLTWIKLESKLYATRMYLWPLLL